ncbi:MAG: hypothetical protein M1453_05730 [Acidobacteria bacterium]|nr:hypothetical protein [Acidobacteriota bacterium]
MGNKSEGVCNSKHSERIREWGLFMRLSRGAANPMDFSEVTSGSGSNAGPLSTPLKAGPFLKNNGSADDGNLWTALAGGEVQPKHFAQADGKLAVHVIRNPSEYILAAEHAGPQFG